MAKVILFLFSLVLFDFLQFLLGMHDISATISVSADKCPFFCYRLSARFVMMAFKCLKYDWNHFEKDNTLMFPGNTYTDQKMYNLNAL